MVNGKCEKVRLGFFFESARRLVFLNGESETSKRFKSERKKFIFYKTFV